MVKMGSGRPQDSAEHCETVQAAERGEVMIGSNQESLARDMRRPGDENYKISVFGENGVYSKTYPSGYVPSDAETRRDLGRLEQLVLIDWGVKL